MTIHLDKYTSPEEFEEYVEMKRRIRNVPLRLIANIVEITDEVQYRQFLGYFRKRPALKIFVRKRKTHE